MSWYFFQKICGKSIKKQVFSTNMNIDQVFVRVFVRVEIFNSRWFLLDVCPNENGGDPSGSF